MMGQVWFQLLGTAGSHVMVSTPKRMLTNSPQSMPIAMPKKVPHLLWSLGYVYSIYDDIGVHGL